MFDLQRVRRMCFSVSVVDVFLNGLEALAVFWDDGNVRVQFGVMSVDRISVGG